MGKINREFLAISGVKSILNFFDGKHEVEFNSSDFAVSSPTDRIQIKAWREQEEFLKTWKEDYEKGGRSDPIVFPSRDSKTEAFKFFAKRMSSKKIPFLPGLFGLDENATLQQILAKSEELKYPIYFECWPLSKKKLFKVSAANPVQLQIGPTKEFHPVWTYTRDREILSSVYPGVVLSSLNTNFFDVIDCFVVSISVLMDEDFENPCFHDIVEAVTRKTDVVREIMEFVKSHARPETQYINCKYYSKRPIDTISHIEGNIVYSFQRDVGSLSYKPDLAGKEIFKKILEVTPKGTLLHPFQNDTEKIMKNLDLAHGPTKKYVKEGVMILEWMENALCSMPLQLQVLVCEGRVFVRRLDGDGTLSKDCFEIDRNCLASYPSLEEMVDRTMKSTNSDQDDLSSSSPKEGEKEEESTIIPSSSSLTQKTCIDEPKILPKQMICSLSTARTTAQQISGNFNQKTNQKKGLIQKPDIGNQGNQDPSRTQSQGKPKFVLVDVHKNSKGNKKPNKTRRKDVERPVPDKTKVDMIRLSLIATVCCLIGAGFWFVKVPGEKGEFIDVTRRRPSRSHKNEGPRKKK